MHKVPVMFAVVFAIIFSVVVRGQQTTIDVYKSATCGCCNKWVDHLRAHGFTVRTTNREDLSGLKAAHHVPRQLQSCHLALVNGYAVEGHVPAADVQRLLRERPAIAGLAVPGMPIGSPGMEMPGSAVQPFDVIAFDKNGQTRVFARHGR
jgi:hypothetical protein